jgi:V/A-type H+-transporting ATPase subunit I
MMFAYCGASTMIFGALSGSWAADLPDYLGEGNAWSRVADALAVVKPLDKAVALLMVCLGIGVANQLYGICLKGYGLIRRGKVAAAVFDAGLWLLALPGFLIVVSPLFLPTPGGLFRVGLAVFGAGAAGLVLTQGRHEKGFFARAVTGLVSLYGILGTYGCVSFIGDMLSYSRLLALGLTTSIVGMSFNIIAELVRGVPYAGVALFALVVVFGHLFNFAVSILGSFVHPARLIFLEFFNRFYEGGGVRFAPLSLDTDRVQVEA